MGLQSQTIQWINQSKCKTYFSEQLAKKGGVACTMMGKTNQRKLIRHYQTPNPSVATLKLVLSIIVIQQWCDLHQITVEV